MKIRTTNHGGYIGLPFCPLSFFNTNTINLTIDWGDGSSQTITSVNDPSIELNSSTQAITVKHSYVNKEGSSLITISGGFGSSGQEKLAFAQTSKQNSEGVAEDFDGRGPKSTPEKIKKIFGDISNFYMHGQGDFKDFSNLILLGNDITPLLSVDPANTIQFSGSGTYLMNQTFENVGALDSYLSQSSSGKIVNENCTSLQKTFKNSSFNGPIGGWNVSSVTDASGMFEGSQAFQQNIAGFNWAALKNASAMFKNSSFKGNINPWFRGSAKDLEDTSNMFEGVSFTGNSINTLDWNFSTVKSTKEMFKNSDFTGGNYINGWFSGSNSLENASGMFEGCTKFNRYIGGWDVSGATNLSNMFKDTTLFNQGIGGWTVSSVTDASGMFEGSQAFQQNIAALNWAALKNASSMFKNSTFTGSINPWFRGSAKVLEDASNMFEGVSFTGNPINTLDWNFSTVKSTKEMFKNSDFTGGSYVNNWFKNTNVLENASGMFEGTTKFNQWIPDWDVTKVKFASKMFKDSVFNQGIGSWALDSAENLDEMFSGNSVFNKWIGTWHEHISKVKTKDNFAGSHGSFSTPNFNKYPQNLNASVATNGLEVTINVSISANLDFWTYQINSNPEVIGVGDSVSKILEPGTYSIKVFGYATDLTGQSLKDSLISTFNITEDDISTNGFLPTKLVSLLGA